MQQIDRILRRKEVERLTGFGRSQIYALMVTGQFPRQIKLSARAVGWRESEVVAWLNTRQAA